MCHSRDENELQKIKTVENMGDDTMGSKKEHHLKQKQWSAKGKKLREEANIQWSCFMCSFQDTMLSKPAQRAICSSSESTAKEEKQ